jgi:DNA-binding LacI/PurR family transcriptional regulator
MAVTLHDVAREAGVSIKTVSNVVRNQGKFTEETRARVQQAVDRLGYTPNIAARGLRSGRLGVIGLIVPDIRNPYFAELADAVMRAAAEHDLLVVLEQSDGDPQTEMELLRGARTRMVDGFLFSVLGLQDGDPELTRSVTTPVVVLGEAVPGWDTDCVSMHHEDGTAASTGHLLDSGRRRVAVLGARTEERVGSAELRFRGYRRGLEERGLTVSPDLVVDIDIWGRAQGAAAIHQLLDRGVTFDGVVAFNDALALGAMRALEECGLSTPGDVAVVGFDDIEEARFSRPTLTTVHPDLHDIARTATGYLLDRVSRPHTIRYPREHRAPCDLRVRESSAPAELPLPYALPR